MLQTVCCRLFSRDLISNVNTMPKGMFVIRKREKMYLYVSVVSFISHPMYLYSDEKISSQDFEQNWHNLQFLKKWEGKFIQGTRLMVIYSWCSRLCYRYLCQYSTYKIGHLHCCLFTQGTQNWGLCCSSWYLTLQYFTVLSIKEEGRCKEM